VTQIGIEEDTKRNSKRRRACVTAAKESQQKNNTEETMQFLKRAMADGRMVHSMFLFEVKKPEESKAPWDYYKLLAEVPGDVAFRPLKDGGCPLIKTN
jgi:hypothetical protein